MERPNNNQPPYRYNTNIELRINQPPQQPQSSHGGNTVQPPPPAHMYNQHAYSYNTNNVAGTSQPPQPTHFSHAGNTARLPPPAHMNNQILFWNNTNNAPCNTNPPRPTQFSCGGNTAIIPARAHMNNQPHRINSVSGTCQPPHFGQVVNTARLPPPAHMNNQPYNMNSVPWNSQPSQPLTHGPNTAMPTQTTAGCSLAPLQNHIQASLGFWLQCVNEWYPDRHKKTYFLPHLFFRKTQHRIAVIDHLGHLPVLVPEPPPKKPKLEQVPLYPPPLAQTHPIFPVAGSVFTLPHSDPAPLPRFIETDVLDDDAAERLLRCLRVLSKEHHEVMMVISQLDFRKYLDNNTDPINAANNAAACANLPRPVTMQQQQHHDGDFDVLIIHRHYGLIVCEVKAVGADRRNTPDLNQAVVGKVIKALKQLNKAKTVLNHLMSDMGPVQVTKTLVLPNVTSAELMQALSTAPQLQKDLCTCHDAKNLSEAITRCLCADQIHSNSDLQSMSNQGNSTGQTNQPTSGASTSSSQTSASPTFPLLSSWWQNITSLGAGPDQHMSDTVYDKLLARFCGPATTVEVPTVTAPRKAMAKPGKYTPASKVVRTEGEAVAETGLIHSLLALYPDQVDLLSDNTLCCVHLRGPPGTGKTIVLVIKAIQWLHQGHDVHVVSVVNESRAVSLLIERQLQCVLGSNPASGFGTVHRHDVNPYTPPDANKLAALASDGELYVIADEVFGSTSVYRYVSACHISLMGSLLNEGKQLVHIRYMWSASHLKV
ncbi:hypothetical protein V1264_009041 [Littorina saxatilis]|uniref:Uncharacterized protein n=2 Tax=Littorina saxatilis TaxID=31220 RepID=A0AAN9AQK9_9CAEN